MTCSRDDAVYTCPQSQDATAGEETTDPSAGAGTTNSSVYHISHLARNYLVVNASAAIEYLLNFRSYSWCTDTSGRVRCGLGYTRSDN
jgi:hypothetical protein